MSGGSLSYLERFIRGLDKIETGRPGGISNDKWLVIDYRPEYGPILTRYLSYDNEQVRAETVMLLTDVKELLAADIVRKMSRTDTEKVKGACVGYLTAISETEEKIPKLLETIRFKNGEEFSKAANLLGTFGRKEDIDDIRKVYGMVKGKMREEIHLTLSKIIGRYPDLQPKSELILSVPVRPDEDSFDRFVNKAIEYLDIRYRGNISPQNNISADTGNNILSALKKMRIRLYNESDNLERYGAEETDLADRLSDLISWAYDDLANKAIYNSDTGNTCSECGTDMIFYKGFWSCPKC